MVGDRHAVERVVVAAAGAAAERQQRRVGLVLLAVELRIARRNHRRHGGADQERRAARARKRLHRRVVEHRALRGIRRFNQRRLAGDRHVLGDRTDVHRQIEGEELLRADADAGSIDRLVALEGDLQPVSAGVDRREHVLAALVGHDRSADVRAFVGEGHFRPRQHAAGILHRAANTALKALSEYCARGSRTEQHCQEPDTHSHVSLRSLLGTDDEPGIS
jgi:hypothetical protein